MKLRWAVQAGRRLNLAKGGGCHSNGLSRCSDDAIGVRSLRELTRAHVTQVQLLFVNVSSVDAERVSK